MAYLLTERPDRRDRRRRRRFLVVMITVVMLSAGTGALLASRDGGAPTQVAASPPSDIGTITWSRVGPTPVPISPDHGPFDTAGGLASGFAHDELGAVLAAIHISVRLTGQAGLAVAESTARRQTVGDIGGSVGTLRDQRSDAAAGGTTPAMMLYRIVGGDPRSDVVVVSIALETPQSREMGGFAAELSRTLQWIDGDWRMQVPPSRPRLVTSVAGYTPLGGPGA